MNILLTIFLFYLQVVNCGLLKTTRRQGSGLAEVNTCNTAAKKFLYDYVNLKIGKYATYYDVTCGYPPAIGTLLLCSYNIGGNDTETQKHVYKQMARRCQAYSSYKYPSTFYEEQFKNASDYYIPLSNLNVSMPIYSPTLPNITSLEKTYQMAHSTNFNIDAGTWFAVAFYGYYLFVILISFLYNLSRILGVTKAINNSNFAKYCQKLIIFPTLFPKGKYSQPYGFKFFTMLFPNRIQFLTDLIFFAMEVAFYCVNYRYSSKGYWMAYVGYRSGIMALGKIPLLILFAGRNNFLLYITGWSYCTFLHFHKVIATWMFIDALIHSVAYTIDVLGYYVEECHYTYFACGIAATTFAGLILLQSFHIFRSFFYEYFLTIHIVFAICFIACTWYHCNILGWMEWLVAACCVWFFDRLIRVIRMSAFGYKKAKITVVGDQLMKLEVSKPSWWIHTSGTYGYIYFAGIIFWENHPFTVVVENDKICAYIRVKMGVTARVWKKLIANNNEMNWKICIEGPYGGNLSPMAKRYDEAIFIAGGSGAPGILEGATKATHGKFIWISQNLGFVTAYKSLIEKVSIPIDIYITRENCNERKCSIKELISETDSDTQSSDGDGDGSEKISSDQEIDYSSSQISIYYRRPDINEIINYEVNDSTSNNVAIVACGPPIMMDSLRHVVSDSVTKWDKSIDFFDEFQIW